MKQILLLLLFPCLCLAQYTGNANQKITLGEQTTADGLVFRGVENDTALITPRSDTSAYIILDTVNNKFYNYNRTTNVWSLAGGGVSVSSFSAGTTGLTPNTATTGAVTLGGTLAVANGGTGSATKNFVDLTTAQTVAGTKTFTSEVTGARFNPTASTITGTGMYLINSDALGFSVNDLEKLRINDNGSLQFTGELTSSKTSGSVFSATSATTGSLFYRIKNTGNDFYIGIDGATAQDFGNGNNAVVFYGSGNANMNFATNNNYRMTIDGFGTVKINNLAGSGDRAVEADVNGVLSAPVSSITTKENVQSLDYGLNEILQINPVSFNYIDKYKWGEERKLGFIVEDIFPVVPEVTGTMNNGDMYLDMTKLIPILTKAIQEQQALIKALEQRILTLENK